MCTCVRCSSEASWSGPRRRSAGFTLVELLVVAGVVAALVAVSVPAFLGARRSAGIAAGQGHLRGVMQLHAAASAENGGHWVNAFPPGSENEIQRLSGGHTLVVTDRCLVQTELWALALVRDLPEGAAQVRSLATPKIADEWPEWTRTNPQAHAGASYLYSPGLYTDAALWTPGVADRAAVADDHRKRIGTHEVAHPAAKVAMAERADHYGTGARLGPAEETNGVTAFNLGMADGAVRREPPTSAAPALDVVWPEETPDLPGVLPFLTTAGGSRSLDVRH